MAGNADTKPNFILFYKNKLGFSTAGATALYEDQLFRDAATAEFSDSRSTVFVARFAVTPICRLPN
jgi:hypothetical protein